MRFLPQEALTEEEIQSGLKAVVRDGLASQAMLTLTGGAFLAAFALGLGASNVVIGLLAAIPPLAQLIQIPALYLVERHRNRRRICVYASALARVFWLLIALIPFLFSTEAGLTFLIVALLLHSGFAAVSNCAWNPWMRDLVPQEQLGAFFSKRMRLATGLSLLLSLAAGGYIDYWKRAFPPFELFGYSVLFFLGFLAGMIGIYFLSTISEPSMEPVKQRPRFLRLLLAPLKDTNLKRLILFLGPWNFAVNLAAPFFTVYMLKTLNLNLSLVVAFTVLSQLMSLAFLRIWGKVADRFSNKSVLSVSGPLFILCILAWTFTTLPERYFLTLPLLIAIHIFMGISTAGVALTSGNIGLKLAPKGEATAYLAAVNFINSLAAGVAPLAGGALADFFSIKELSWVLSWSSPSRELTVETLNFQHWDFLFFIAVLLALYSIHRLAMVREVGEVKEKVIVQELMAEVRRNMRTLTTVGGLRYLVQFPLSILATRYKMQKRLPPVMGQKIVTTFERSVDADPVQHQGREQGKRLG